MGDNAFAAGLVPGVFGTPGGNVLHVFGGSTETSGAFSGGAVASTGVGQGEGDQNKHHDDLHYYRIINQMTSRSLNTTRYQLTRNNFFH